MERDLSVFDKNVMELFELSKDILKAHEKRKLKGIDRATPFLTHLEKYMKTYSKTQPEEHTSYFEKIFTNNKRVIMLGAQRDGWLIDAKPPVIISYGEDYGLKTEMKFHMTAIYFTACQMRDEIKEENDGLPNVSESPELNYPSRFLLHLYHIFHEVTSSDNEKTKLATHIDTLKSSIGIRSSNGGDSMSSLFDMVEQTTGMKIPRDKMPANGDITKMFGEVFNDPKAKSMISSVMNSLKNADGAGDIVTKLVGALGSAAGGGGTNSDSQTSQPAASIENASTVNDEFSD